MAMGPWVQVPMEARYMENLGDRGTGICDPKDMSARN